MQNFKNPGRPENKPGRRMLRRGAVLSALFGVLAFAVLLARLYKLQIIDHEKYESMAIEQQLRSTPSSASRGSIYDRNMNVLAVSASVDNVYLSPVEIESYGEDRVLIAEGLSEILGLDYDDVYEKTGRSGSWYVTVARKIEKEKADAVRTFKAENDLHGVRLETDTKRSYPNSALACHLIGFVGTILAFIVGLSVMGGSLKGLAIAAGALSLGAGLGLQNVVNNFVSGIILLFERPFKIGDWILVDQYEGIVKQINMRSTQIETFNKSNVIIPNATLLSTSLINMTYKNKQARVDLLIGVDYDSDIALVKSTLLECVQETKNILQLPNPYVSFLALADNSLNFRLSFYISDVGNKLSVQTEVYTLIVEKFRERNINIPYPQRVLHIKNEADLKESDIVAE